MHTFSITMAEALGIASSVLAILEASAKIANYLKQVRDAPQERERFINELQLLDGVLRSLKEKERQCDPQTLGILQRPIRELEALLYDLALKLDASDGGGGGGGGSGGGQSNSSGSTGPPPGSGGFPQSSQGGNAASFNTTGTASSSTGSWRNDFREQREKLAERAKVLGLGKSKTGSNPPSSPPTPNNSTSSSNLAQPPGSGSQQTPVPRKSRFGFGKQLTWPFKRGEVLEILATVDRYKSYFVLAIQNDIE